MQITSAMKMVSAAKLRRAQDRVQQMRPYAEKLTEIMGKVSSSLDASENAYAEEREVKTVLLVVVTSNRGLCGAFNANVIKKANELIRTAPDGVQYKVITVGKRAFDHFKKTPYLVDSEVITADNHELYEDLHFDVASEIPVKIMKQFEKGTFDEVHLIYNQFKNAATQLLQVEQFLPIVTDTDESGKKDTTDYIYEPSKREILDDLIPKSLKTQFYKAVLDSNASEHGARMTAMHKATENAKELLSNLKLSYNKARQAAITTEILEIVGGANALDEG